MRFNLEQGIRNKHFWAWRHASGSCSVGYIVRLVGAYERVAFKVYLESTHPYGTPQVHVTTSATGELIPYGKLLRSTSSQSVLSEWPLYRGLDFAHHSLFCEIVSAVRLLFEQADRRRAKRLLHDRLPSDMVSEIVSFI